jgi:hypothetical protein
MCAPVSFPRKLSGVEKGESCMKRKNVLMGSWMAAALFVFTAAPSRAQVSSDPRILINDPAVLDDSRATRWSGLLNNPSDPTDGAWHFGKLMTQMAGASDPSDFVMGWLQSWASNQNINGMIAPARPAVSQIINGWPKVAGTTKLDLTKSPLRLLAIVNRLDLRFPRTTVSPLMPVQDAGEGRFIYGFFDPRNPGSAFQFTVILEYKLKASNGGEVMDWARGWHAIASEVKGSEQFKVKLQALTDRFSGAGSPNELNGSAIGQVRTNEIHLSSPWELREFRLSFQPSTKTVRLQQSETTNSASFSLSGTPALGAFVSDHDRDLASDNFQLPKTYLGNSVLGASSLNSLTPWVVPNVPDKPAPSLAAKANFALESCNGCHGTSTNTRFLHVGPRVLGQPSVLSRFLQGEITRRGNLLNGMVGSGTIKAASVSSVSGPETAQQTALGRVH